MVMRLQNDIEFFKLFIKISQFVHMDLGKNDQTNRKIDNWF